MPTIGNGAGEIIGIYINNQLIASSTSCEYDFTIDERETTTKDDQGRTTYQPTKTNANISGEFLKREDVNMNYNDIFSLAYNRTLFTWRKGSVVQGDRVHTGTGFFTNIKESAGQYDNITGSYSIRVTGPITITTNP